MRIEAVELLRLVLPMVEPLTAAHGTLNERVIGLVCVRTDVGNGWGECSSLPEPTYSPDWADGELLVLERFLAPALLGKRFEGAAGVTSVLAPYAGHNAAKAALVMAVLDAELRSSGRSLAEYWGVVGATVPSIAVLGLVTGEALLARVERCVAAGYRHVKLKVAPGADADCVESVRRHFPHLGLRVDANGSYRSSVSEHRSALDRLDSFGLASIEQPLPEDDLRGQIVLAERLSTPVAADESVTSVLRAHALLDLGAASALAVKPSAVGGPLATIDLGHECRRRGLPFTIGGMVDTGIARAVNLALAAVVAGDASGPAEVSPDGRWFSTTLVHPMCELGAAGALLVPTGPGLGIDVDVDVVDHFTTERQVIAQ